MYTGELERSRATMEGRVYVRKIEEQLPEGGHNLATGEIERVPSKGGTEKRERAKGDVES